MSFYPPAYPTQTYSRPPSWRKPVPLPSVGEDSEIFTDASSDHSESHDHGVWGRHEDMSDQAPLMQRTETMTRSKGINRSNTWRSMRSFRSTRSQRLWLQPLDNIMPDSTSEEWKNPFPTISISVLPDPDHPLAGACYPMPIAYPTEDRSLLDLDPNFEVSWAIDGSDMPRNWPAWYRGLILAFVSFATLVVIMTSTAYSPGIPGMMESFGIKNRTIPILGVTTYLFGLAFGPLVLAPLSEIYGRRPVYIVSLFLFSIFLIPSAVAKNFATILVTRFMAAFVGSVVMSGAPGTLADICTEDTRTRYISIWILGAVNGPVIGPVCAGMIYQYAGWRWISWWLVILAFISCALMASIAETNGNIILKKRCEKLKVTDGRYWTKANAGDSLKFSERLNASIRQPVIMILTEPICTFWDLYVATVYAILYLCIVGYPIVFSKIRGWSPAVASLPFLSIGLGSCLTVAFEPKIRKVMKALSSQATSESASADATLPIILIGGILIPIGQLLFAVSAAPPNSPVVAILAGIPLGMGNMLIFLYVANYLATCYKAHAASALAGHASMRYLGAALLPLLAPVLYNKLGPLVTGLILMSILSVLAAVPIVFMRKGEYFKARSKMAHGVEVCKEKGCKTS